MQVGQLSVRRIARPSTGRDQEGHPPPHSGDLVGEIVEGEMLRPSRGGRFLGVSGDDLGIRGPQGGHPIPVLEQIDAKCHRVQRLVHVT